MQAFEYVLLGLVLIGSAQSLWVRPDNPNRWIHWGYVAATVLVLAAQLAIEGPHWQIWPLYLALAIALLLQLTRSRNRKLLGTILACMAFGLAVSSAALCWVLPVFSLPSPTGPYAIGTHSEIIEDRTRNVDGVTGSTASGRWRRMPIRVWYPAMPQTGHGKAKYINADEIKPMLRYRALVHTNSITDADPISSQTFPTLLFAPKWNGSRVQDTFLTEDLASHGYIVVAIDHPGNATFADTGSGVMQCTDPYAVSVPPATSAAAVQMAWRNELKIWQADDEAVLNALIERTPDHGQAAGFYYAVDSSRVGAFGHSFGAAAAMALLGVDPRVKSAVNLDGWIFNGLDHRTTQPILLFYEAVAENPQSSLEAGAEGELDAADRASVTRSLTRFGGQLAYITGAQHLDFTDQTLVSPIQRITFTGPIRGERMRQIARGLVLGFFDQTLKGTGNLPAYPEVKVRKIAGAER